MSMVSLARRPADTRPDWLPHPLVLNLIAALWAGAAILQLLAGPHA